MNASSSTSNRTWFITGATSGIGQALAVAALERGDNVAATSRHATAFTEFAAYGDRVLLADADVTDQQSVTDAVAATVARFGTIDVVVSNAAFGIFGGVEEISDTQWRSIFDTNVFGALNVLRATLPILRKQQSGWILQASAHYGQHAHAGVSAVAATKHAMEGWTDALVEELAPLGIKVLNFEPGMTATPFLSKLGMGEDAQTDYDPTVRANLKALGSLPPEAFNAPDRVADAILTAMDADQPPNRLATGSGCYEMISGTLAARTADLETWADLTKSVDSPAVPA